MAAVVVLGLIVFILRHSCSYYPPINSTFHFPIISPKLKAKVGLCKLFLPISTTNNGVDKRIIFLIFQVKKW